MGDYSQQASNPTNGLESAGVGSSGQQQGLPVSLEQQGLPVGAPYATAGLTYPPQYLLPQLAAQQEQLRQFWQGQMQEIHQVGTDPAEFKNHQLPLARIKKIMKSDEDVRMISAEAPVLFARACETFILELTLRSWNHSEENKRRTLQRNDIAAAITRTDIFDFLVDIVPREERGDDAAAPRPASGTAVTSAPAGGLPYWQQPMAAGAPGSVHIMGPRPPMQMDPAVLHYYMQQQAQQQQQQQQQTQPYQQQEPPEQQQTQQYQQQEPPEQQQQQQQQQQHDEDANQE